jgi:hypothetical protein
VAHFKTSNIKHLNHFDEIVVFFVLNVKSFK